ncbi:hypothetical protein VCUG_00564 [Vavraia culicis subsp. floridensis]|uniref:Uncharacterized protein n=1 Tax=Vavraia culicis (isolate floridensis) TaxID=948595 RepID=L2GWD4_VAVCU|nr:uncharacterized protein VCUG_00564 [Vavraia culicis subsp. floridensis]ELA47981.1 hypothetical protein VCUG_00564 [Vavraia culicis subsp. floridensis]
MHSSCYIGWDALIVFYGLQTQRLYGTSVYKVFQFTLFFERNSSNFCTCSSFLDMSGHPEPTPQVDLVILFDIKFDPIFAYTSSYSSHRTRLRMFNHRILVSYNVHRASHR